MNNHITPLNLHKIFEFNNIPKVRYEIFSDKIVIWPQPESNQAVNWKDWSNEILFNDPKWLIQINEIFGELKPLPTNSDLILKWWHSNYIMSNPASDKVLILEDTIDSYELKHYKNKIYVLARLPKYLPTGIIQNKLSKLIDVYEDIDL